MYLVVADYNSAIWEALTSAFEETSPVLATLIGTVSIIALARLIYGPQKEALVPGSVSRFPTERISREGLDVLSKHHSESDLHAHASSGLELKKDVLESVEKRRAQLRKAQDTLAVWKVLAGMIEETAPSSYPTISEHHLIEKEGEFSDWFNLHKEALDQHDKLDLRNNNLSGVPPEIFQLQNLRFLHLENNNLSELPPEIGQLQNLLFLYLVNNNFSELPHEFAQLQNLTWLCLDNNKFSELPPEFAQLQNQGL